jgi:uncharacterized protein YyaL (SSP411 family)
MEARPANRLATQTSPYLLQHAHNPVDWYPWGPEALDRARAEDRPIFLSIGYAACHWCHVMERESFENPETAAQLNRDFVPIKVDREERPDLDDVYMAAVQAMTGGGGWPMSVFLTPQLRPFFGGTYFPPEDRHGLPAFGRVLAAVADAYRTRRDEVERQAGQLADHLQAQLTVPGGDRDPELRQLEGAVARLASVFDPAHGGFGGAPKFPAPMTLEFLLRAWHRSRDPATLRMVTRTLDAMADGGINDQLGGGFARYSTDAHWLVPHFEKMLYDNALLAHAYLEAWRATGNDRYARVARDTLDFCLLELRTDDGGFASSLDADTEGEEGRYYTWRHDEFMAVLHDAGLDEDRRHVLAGYWGLTVAGTWEGTNVLHRTNRVQAPDELLERARRALTDARERRVRPARDEKQLAAWNGLLLRALASAALALGEDRYEDATRRLVDFIRTQLVRDGDRLWRTARDGRAHTPGFCEDSVSVADGLLAAHAALGDGDALRLARALMERAVADFWDDESGTFADTSDEHDRTVARPRGLLDGATPSANAVGADVMLRLALLTGDEEMARRGRAILRAVAPAVERQPSAFGRMLGAMDRSLAEQIDAVVAADDPGSEDARALRRAAASVHAPNLLIAAVHPGDAHAGWPLFEGKAAREGRATAYVCRGYACDEPTSDPARVSEQVRGLAAAR